MKPFIPIDAKHDRYDIVYDGRFSIGDYVTFVYKDSSLREKVPFTFQHWYRVGNLDATRMYLEGFGGTPLIRGPDSVYAYARKNDYKEYDLDQKLDQEEDLL